MVEPYLWLEAYIAAVNEKDSDRLATRITEAKAAIKRRLESPVEAGSEESRELVWAKRALAVLESERVTKSA